MAARCEETRHRGGDHGGLERRGGDLKIQLCLGTRRDLQLERPSAGHTAGDCSAQHTLCGIQFAGREAGRIRYTRNEDLLQHMPRPSPSCCVKSCLERQSQSSSSSLPDTSAGSSAVLSSSVGWWLIAPVNHRAAARYCVYFSDSNLVLALFHTCHCVFFLTLEACRKRTVINGAIHPHGSSFIIL